MIMNYHYFIISILLTYSKTGSYLKIFRISCGITGLNTVPGNLIGTQKIIVKEEMRFGNINMGFLMAKMNPFIPPTLHLFVDFSSTIFLLYACQRAFLVFSMRCGCGHQMDALVIKSPLHPCSSLIHSVPRQKQRPNV